MDVGLSFLKALKAATLFIFFTSLEILRFTVLTIPFLYTSLISLVISIFFHPSINIPLILGKRSDGRFPIWSLIVFGPFLLFVRAFSTVRRFTGREAPYSEICEGLYVGGWPYALDKSPPGNPAIIDCTCELPRKRELLGHDYICIPVWDTRAPQPDQIEFAVKWACRKRAQNIPIFIHCAYGHGRSVAVMCAVLVDLGLAEDWKSAEKLIKEKRPCIRMNALHCKALEEWSKDRLLFDNRNSSPSTFILAGHFLTEHL